MRRRCGTRYRLPGAPGGLGEGPGWYRLPGSGLVLPGHHSAFVLLALWLGFGRYGSVVLGQPGDRPELSAPSWLSMLFAAGMGMGLLFWGVAEPVNHFTAPPLGEGGSREAARNAAVYTIFHWGLHAWGIYCLSGLVLAYFGFRYGFPHLAGTPIRAMFAGRWVGPVAWLADLVAVLAVGPVGLLLVVGPTAYLVRACSPPPATT